MISTARPIVGVLAVGSIALLAGCRSRTEVVAASTATVPLYDDLGSHHHTITASAEAQKYFDQGLRLMYAFNHDEAVASFRQGAGLDAGCGMCWWGVAAALGPNINLPMDSKAGADAWDATRKAVALPPSSRRRSATISRHWRSATRPGRRTIARRSIRLTPRRWALWLPSTPTTPTPRLSTPSR